MLEDEFNSALGREAAMKDFYPSQWGIGLDPELFTTRLKFSQERLPELGVK